MYTRPTRVLCVWLMACLLTGLFARTAAVPILVCRITGLPMAPVVVTGQGAAAKRCCAVRAELAADAVRYRLMAPGCCDLKIVGGNAAKTPAVLTGWEMPQPALLALVKSVVPPAESAHAPVRWASAPAAPRGPPWRPSSPRAPPLVS